MTMSEEAGAVLRKSASRDSRVICETFGSDNAQRMERQGSRYSGNATAAISSRRDIFGNHFFACFPGRRRSSMQLLPKLVLSPSGRKVAEMVSRKNGRKNCSGAPVFSKLPSAGSYTEPTSPQVTCIGQVKVRKHCKSVEFISSEAKSIPRSRSRKSVSSCSSKFDSASSPPELRKSKSRRHFDPNSPSDSPAQHPEILPELKRFGSSRRDSTSVYPSDDEKEACLIQNDTKNDETQQCEKQGIENAEEKTQEKEEMQAVLAMADLKVSPKNDAPESGKEKGLIFEKLQFKLEQLAKEHLHSDKLESRRDVVIVENGGSPENCLWKRRCIGQCLTLDLKKHLFL